MALPNFTYDERKAFLAALAGLTPAKIEQITLVELGEPIGSYGTIHDEMPVLSIRLIQWIAPHTDKLILFLDAFIGQYLALDQIPVMKAHCARLKQIAPPTITHPCDAVLIDTAVMVNRAPLRTTLRNITGGFTRPVIVINGPEKSGRSLSWNLIDHVATANGIAASLFKLDAPPIGGRTLDWLFGRIADKLGIAATVTRPAKEGVQVETIGKAYANAIVDAFPEVPDGEQRWLIFDSIDKDDIDNAIPPFIRQLCERRLELPTGEPKRCTIFLLGESAKFAAPERGLIARESLTAFFPGEIGEAAHYINGIGSAPLADAALAARVATIVAELQGCPPLECGALLSARLTELRMDVGAP